MFRSSKPTTLVEDLSRSLSCFQRFHLSLASRFVQWEWHRRGMMHLRLLMFRESEDLAAQTDRIVPLLQCSDLPRALRGIFRCVYGPASRAILHTRPGAPHCVRPACKKRVCATTSHQSHTNRLRLKHVSADPTVGRREGRTPLSVDMKETEAMLLYSSKRVGGLT